MARLSQGTVCWAELPEPAGKRPVVVLTRSEALARLDNVTVAPLTRTVRGWPTEVPLTPAQDGVKTDCVVSLDNILTIPKQYLANRITTLSRARLEQVHEAVRRAFAMA